MLVTLDGIVTEVSPLQFTKASKPMLVTLDGIVTVVSPSQPVNAYSPMLVTLERIVTSPFTPAISVLPSFEHSSPFDEQ